jgi:hypothetical protein
VNFFCLYEKREERRGVDKTRDTEIEKERKTRDTEIEKERKKIH